jgi:anti-sigma-K factor RskA
MQRRFWVDVGVQERSRRKRLERAVTLEEELERDLERVQEQLNALGLSRREMVGFWTELRERIDDEPPLQFGASMQSHETN